MKGTFETDSEIDKKLDQLDEKLDLILSKLDDISLEPEPIPEPKVIFYTDFNNGLGDWKDGSGRWNSKGEIESHWSAYGSDISTKIVNFPLDSNLKSLEIRTNGRSEGLDHNGQVRQNNNPQYDILEEDSHIIMRQKVYFPQNIKPFNPGTGSGTDYSFFVFHQIKGVSAVKNDSIHSLMVKTRPDGTNYFSVLDGQKRWGSVNTEFQPINDNMSIPTDRLFDLEIEVKMSSTDGIYKVKMDGELLFDLKNQATFPSGFGITSIHTMWSNYHRYIKGVENEDEIKVYLTEVEIIDLNS